MPRGLESAHAMTPISTLHELEKVLAALPSVESGKVRVFRGQTGHFTRESGKPSVLPTCARGQFQPAERIWAAYAALISQVFTIMSADGGTPDLGDPTAGHLSDLDLLRFIAIGFQALSQHYGPGSQFVDVTHSKTVALWFALHHRVQFDAVRLPAPSKLLSSAETITYETITDYEPHTAAPGWLYVFDVDPWDGKSLPVFGSLVDLREEHIPATLRSSLRIERQQACLLCAGTVAAPGDVGDLLKGEPIPVIWPMDGVRELNADVGLLFPDTGHDPWYEVFASIPKALVVDPHERKVVSRRPLDVAIYGRRDDPSVETIIERLKHIEDLAHHPSLSSLSIPAAALPPSWPEHVRERILKYRFVAATRLLAEGPLLATNLPAELWRLEVLAEGIPESAEVHQFGTGRVLGSVAIDSTFLQLSPLEYPFWQRVGRNRDWDLPIGLWFIRIGKRYVLQAFEQRFPDTQIRVQYPLCFRVAGGVFEVWVEASWRRLPNGGKFDAMLFLMLNLLRSLSPEVLESAIVQRPFRQPLAIAPALEKAAASAVKLRLVRISGETAYDRWYLLREADGDQPYAQLSMALIEDRSQP